MKSHNVGEFIRFIIVGVSNTAIYYSLYIVSLYVLHWHYLFAHFGAFFLSLMASYFLNTYFTYRVKPTWKKFFAFPLTQVANTCITTIVIYIVVEYLHLTQAIAPLIAMFFCCSNHIFIDREDIETMIKQGLNKVNLFYGMMGIIVAVLSHGFFIYVLGEGGFMTGPGDGMSQMLPFKQLLYEQYAQGNFFIIMLLVWVVGPIPS